MQFFYKKHFKKSVIFDVMMQVGSFVFTIFKQKQQKNTVRNIDKYIIFSKEKLDFNFEKPSEYLTDFKQFEANEKLNIEVIFDANSFQFSEIIAFMEKNKSKNITFKNYISQSNYLIGSNNANDRGEVINF